MKAQTKNILDKTGQILIWAVGIATLSLILISTVYGVIKAATETSMCIFGIM